MQIYMHLIGMNRAIYLAVCKNTDALYIERLEADREEAERLLAKAKRIIEAPRPLAKLSEDPQFFECRMCSHHAVCQSGHDAVRNCRTCLHSTPVEGGWHCSRHGTLLDGVRQREGCPVHLLIPDLVPGTVTDSGEDFVAYRLRDGTAWIDDARGVMAC